LETFDSDIQFTQGQRNIEKKDAEGNKQTEIEFFKDLKINVRSGWRIYDFSKKQVFDESVFTDEKGWQGKGNTPQVALRNLPQKRTAINEAGYYSGTMYARRISPTWANVSRKYYTKGTQEFKVARRYVRVNNWDGAKEIWMKYVLDPSPKVGGRASYNMALANEVQGDYQTALEWANKSWLNFGLRKGKKYINTLNRRISDKVRLDKQMGE
jgi:hypothetical protein